jgi:hypothetical protein
MLFYIKKLGPVNLLQQGRVYQSHTTARESVEWIDHPTPVTAKQNFSKPKTKRAPDLLSVDSFLSRWGYVVNENKNDVE